MHGYVARFVSPFSRLGATSVASQRFYCFLVGSSLVGWLSYPPADSFCYWVWLSGLFWVAGGDAVAFFLNGASIIRFQIVVASIFWGGLPDGKDFFYPSLRDCRIPWATIGSYAVMVRCHIVSTFRGPSIGCREP